MKKYTAFAILAMFLVFALSATAKEQPRIHKALDITADATDFSKAARDTHYLLGGPTHGADFNGTFEHASGVPWYNGFTSVDNTLRLDVNWHAVSLLPVAGQYSAWCGADFGDLHIGYGNDWNEILELVFAVGNNSVATTVEIAATVNYNTEDGYDYSYLTYYKEGGVKANLWQADGTVTSGLAVAESVTYEPGEYLGGNEIRIAWRLTSDGAWSSQDGLWPGIGGLWVDDCTVTITNDSVVTTLVDDFESGNLGNNWNVGSPIAVGNFTKIWTHLEDFDPCLSNYSAQIAFIDDGEVVPGTEGTPCQTWCYGPNGYVVNTSGGLLGSGNNINNSIVSPVMPWPDADLNGCYFFFDCYRHEPLGYCSACNFYTWSVRSVTGTDPSAIENAPWRDRDLLYYGGPDYIRAGDAELNTLLEPGRTFVQVRASLFQYRTIWSWCLPDGTPAPYFDNFRLLAFPVDGPAISYNQFDLAQDNFPANGTIDFTDLGSNSVRFDMAKNIAPEEGMFINPGDSIVVRIVPIRVGATIDNAPVLHYTIEANELFDSFRTSPTTGSASGVLTGGPIGGQYAFDLPDEGLLFPGDVLHYFIYAEERINGSSVQSATLPPDITQYGNFSDPLKYPSEFTVHALPTVFDDGGDLATPDMLFWNDFGDRGGEDEWYHAFANLGLTRGVDYDIYFTQAPTSAIGNGLGSRATLDLLGHYNTMLYSCGDLEYLTICNGDPDIDPSDDAGLIVEWLASGDKRLFATGDGLASNLYDSGDTTLQLAQQWMGLDLVYSNLRPAISGQTAPLVRRMGNGVSNPVFINADGWIAYGYCPGFNTFDAVEPLAGAVRLAEFTDPSGAGGVYPYSAATLKVNTDVNSHVITMPYDFMNIWTDPHASAKTEASPPVRVQVMKDVLQYFGRTWFYPPVPAPDAIAFSTTNFPNPFNPSTKIEFTMPKAGQLSLRIFDIRGGLVKTLVDGVVEAGPGFRMWDGTNEQGANMSSGVYFYEARTDNDIQVQKMALVK